MLALAVVVVYMFLETTSGTLDRLTNLYSRAKFDEFLRSMKERGELFGLVMIDLDDFKAVNDRYGHQAGDVVLADFSAILKNVFRGERMVSRIGGDEFMIVTTHDADAAARGIAEVRKATAQSKTAPALRRLRFSYGFIQNDPALSTDDLLTQVDHRMYDDKAKNKNAAPMPANHNGSH
jgi:diguanylate cyclase (GGDEF)-like protein